MMAAFGLVGWLSSWSLSPCYPHRGFPIQVERRVGAGSEVWEPSVKGLGSLVPTQMAERLVSGSLPTPESWAAVGWLPEILLEGLILGVLAISP